MDTNMMRPQIRFEGFTDPWEQRKLGELEDKGYMSLNRGEVISKKDIEEFPGEYPIYSASSVNSGQFGSYGKYMFDEELITWSIDGGGCVFYRKPHKFSVTNVCGYIKIYRNFSYTFLASELALLHSKIHFDYTVKAHPSVIRDLYQIVYPSMQEQNNIGLFFRRIDNLITLQQRKCDMLKSLKESMLERMFPKEGETEPRVRFKGFTAPWEPRTLGELLERYGSGGTPSVQKRDYYGGDIPFLNISDLKDRDIVTTEKSITHRGLANSAAWIVPAGSISLAMYASVGKVGIIRADMATSQAFFNMVISDDILRDFIYCRLSKAESFNEWESFISTGTQRNLNADKVRNWICLLPAHVEMELISRLLMALENLIALQRQKCEMLKNVKKSMLDKMFV